MRPPLRQLPIVLLFLPLIGCGDSGSAPTSPTPTQSFLVDTTAPTIASAAVATDGTTVTVTWSENLDQTQAVAGSAFTVNGSAGTGQPTGR